ncbi:hypothetical protein [Gemmatimonas sp.]|uniref:hypothetical protein n=1 Tax=Gemmatimonas sp. TaxID=1962908 RepID=UPI00286A5C05|nr:hypothetical protein [Gemmatimonas sp.]
MLADALALIVDADAPWRVRASVTLSDAFQAAALSGVSASLQSMEFSRVYPMTIALHGDAPTMLVVRERNGPAAVAGGTARQIDDSVFEVVVPRSESVISFVLVLSAGDAEIALPIAAGNVAAIQSLGWGPAAAGARTEVRVRGQQLAEALRQLAPTRRS